jgi:hypothetical protein
LQGPIRRVEKNPTDLQRSKIRTFLFCSVKKIVPDRILLVGEDTNKGVDELVVRRLMR